MLWLRRWGPAILWAAVIWTFSTRAFSAEQTSRFIFPLLRWLLPHATTETLALLHGLLRKCGHLTEYFIFSLLVLRGVRGGRPGWRLAWGVAVVLIAAGYAALDEFHQSFVPERTASPWDLLLDSAGAVIAQFFAWIYVRRHPQPLDPGKATRLS